MLYSVVMKERSSAFLVNKNPWVVTVVDNPKACFMESLKVFTSLLLTKAAVLYLARFMSATFSYLKALFCSTVTCTDHCVIVRH